jgi:hypothetical protein
VPRETIVILLLMGQAFGFFWGCLSLVVWSANERIPPIVIAPLWLTAEIAWHVPIHPYVAAAFACALFGLLPAAIFLAVARARGW